MPALQTGESGALAGERGTEGQGRRKGHGACSLREGSLSISTCMAPETGAVSLTWGLPASVSIPWGGCRLGRDRHALRSSSFQVWVALTVREPSSTRSLVPMLALRQPPEALRWATPHPSKAPLQDRAFEVSYLLTKHQVLRPRLAHLPSLPSSGQTGSGWNLN